MSDIDENNTNTNSEPSNSELNQSSELSNEYTPSPEMSTFTEPENQGPKKKKKKVAIIASIIGIAACATIAAVAGPKIVDALSSRSKSAPIDRFKAVFTDHADNIKDDLNAKDQALGVTNTETTLDLDLSLGNYIMSSIPEAYQFVNGMSAKLNIINFEDNTNTTASISTNSGTLLTLQGYGSTKDSEFAFRIPELSDSYLNFSAKELMSELDNSIPSIKPITPEEISDLISDETSFLTNSIKEVTLKEDSSIEANGISAEYDLLTTVIPAKEFGTMLYQCTERLLNEGYLKEIMKAAQTEYSIDDILDEVKNWADTNTVDIAMNIYLDDDNHLMGFKIIPTKKDSTLEIAYLSATDKETGFTLYVIVDNEKLFSLDGTYNKKKESYTGDMTLNVNQNGIVTPICIINYKNLTCNKDILSGTISLDSPALMGIGFSTDFDIKNHCGTISLKATMSSAELVTLNIQVDSKKATSCPTLPTDANVITYKTEQDIQTYLQSSDLNNFMQNFNDITGINLYELLQ